MSSTATTTVDIDDEGVEEILSSSLQTLYEYTPITHSSANHIFEYTPRSPGPTSSVNNKVVLQTPDTDPANWALHASSVWVASIFIANHIRDLELEDFRSKDGLRDIHVLELGAGAGLPGIFLARTYEWLNVTSSDYPDPKLIQALSSNIKRNDVSSRCRAVPYAWGSDPEVLTSFSDGTSVEGFDVVLAADTLWNPDLHTTFIETLRLTLRKASHSKVHLVAGLHTGRYTLERFLQMARDGGFDVSECNEREVEGESYRDWDVTRAETEDERERRRWVLWLVLKWKTNEIGIV